MTDRSRHRVRSTWIIVAGLVIGTVMNVCIAWGVAIAYQRREHRRSMRMLTVNLFAIAERPRTPRTDLRWPIDVPADWPERPVFDDSKQEMWGTDVVSVHSDFNSFVSGRTTVVRHGVPFRSMSRWDRLWETRSSPRFQFEQGGVIYFEWLPWRTEGEESLPIRPLWPGFALNTFFYAAIAWGLWQIPLAIRRRSRAKRGACVRCGYDLKGLAAGSACPECGSGR